MSETVRSLRSDHKNGLVGRYVATDSIADRSLCSDRLVADRSLRSHRLVADRSLRSDRLILGLPLIARFRHRTRGITCAVKSTGVAHSQQAFPREDIAPAILLSQVPLRPGPHSEPGGGPVP
ncbi:hypothetical protein F2Q69_00029505 [Brassica cretica]|uniref:Uncharacterized protein n=1 Tax=Brassica cretica TaxID=69181 RepID=A0A8S9RV73_BRACR|nr:hypothetical protein F2Q69_00029505 [Brassica cretica]